jgi:pimeloyl-ACP methyl ester carboxylesterase
VRHLERRVATSAGYVAVTERGRASAPPVVLVHGFPDRASLWDEVADDLAADHRVLAYDVRGAGDSTPPATTAGYAFRHLLDDLIAVLDATVGAVPIHLVGHDWGAVQGFAAAASPAVRPRLASFLAVSAPGIGVARAWVGGRLASHRVRDLAALAGQARRSWYVAAFQVPWLPETLFRAGSLERALRRAGHPAPSRTVVADATRSIGLYRANRAAADAGGHAPPGDLPTRVLVGRDDPFSTSDLYEPLRAAGVEVVEVPGGHWLPLTAPARVAAEVRDLVARVR